MSNKGWLSLIIIVILIIYGTIFLIRYTIPEPVNEGVCYDVDSEGIPTFVNTNFIELDKIEYIKRFRSGYGTSQSNDFESCRTMVHAFIPFEEYWSVDREIKVFSPVKGTIVKIGQPLVNDSGDWVYKDSKYLSSISIRPADFPAFIIKINYIDISQMNVYMGRSLSEGQHIGYANLQLAHSVFKSPFISINIKVNTCPSNYEKKLSYFDVMTDKVFQEFKDRGATNREEFIISKEERDSHPLNCTYDNIANTFWIYEKGDIPNWVYLGENPEDFRIVSNYS